MAQETNVTKDETSQDLYFAQNIFPHPTKALVKTNQSNDYEQISNNYSELNGRGSTSFEIDNLSTTSIPAVTTVNVLLHPNFAPLSSVMTLLTPNSITQTQQQEGNDVNSSFCCAIEETPSDVDTGSDSESEEEEDTNPVDSESIDWASVSPKDFSFSNFSDINTHGPLNLVKLSSLSSNPNSTVWNWESSPENIAAALYSMPTTSQICVPDNSIFSPHFLTNNVSSLGSISKHNKLVCRN